MVESDYSVPRTNGPTFVVNDPLGLVTALNAAQTAGGGLITLAVGTTYTPDLTLLSGVYPNIRIRGGGPPSWTFANGLVSAVTGAVISPTKVPTSDNLYSFNGLVIEDVVLTAPITWGSTQRGLMGGSNNQNIWFNRCLIYDWVPPLRKNCGPNIRMTDCHTYMSAAASTNAKIATQIAATGSPQTVTNGSGSNQILFVVGGTVSAQTVAGVALPQQSTYGVRLTNGQASVITYSSNPTIYTIQLSSNIQGDQGPSWFDRNVWDYHPSQEFAVGFAAYSNAPTGAYYFRGNKFGDSGLYSLDAWIDTESNPETAITVTASVFAWTNNAANNPSGGAVQVYVRGGTVSQVQLVTGEVASTIIAAANYATGTTLEVGDTINVTYTGAPTMAYMNQYLPECVVEKNTIVNGKVYAVNFGKYSVLDNDFRLTINYNGSAPHFVQSYNPTANPGSGGQLTIKGNTFRQPRWITAAGVDLEVVADPVALALARDGALTDLYVEDNTFFLSNEPSGIDNGVSAPVYVFASANCTQIGNVTIRNNRFGWVDTGGTSGPLLQIWSDNATTGSGIQSITIDGQQEIAANTGGGDGLSPATVLPVYTWALNLGLAAKTSIFGKIALYDSNLPNAANATYQKLGTWTVGSGSSQSLDVRNFSQRFANSDIAGASPLTVGPFNNGTAYTLAIKQPALVVIDSAATTNYTSITLQTAGGTTRTIVTGVPTATVPIIIPVMVGDVLTLTFTVANPTHVWVIPFSTGL
jgi:hypothetical protein